MRKLIYYIRSCFCKHEWELIFSVNIIDEWDRAIGHCKTYRCTKCGYSRKYKS